MRYCFDCGGCIRETCKGDCEMPCRCVEHHGISKEVKQARLDAIKECIEVVEKEREYWRNICANDGVDALENVEISLKALIERSETPVCEAPVINKEGEPA